MDNSTFRPLTSYPSNSQRPLGSRPEDKRAEEPKKEKKVERVTKGAVKQHKKSFGKKIVETFVGEDVGNVGEYVIHDILVPAVKSMLFDMVTGSFEMSLFGERKGHRGARAGQSRVNYGGYSSIDRGRNAGPREFSQRARTQHDFRDIELTTSAEADAVLGHMFDLIADYGQVTVGDLYDLVGITANFTDAKYGWTDLRGSTWTRVRSGYLLNLPRPILLD